MNTIILTIIGAVLAFIVGYPVWTSLFDKMSNYENGKLIFFLYVLIAFAVTFFIVKLSDNRSHT